MQAEEVHTGIDSFRDMLSCGACLNKANNLLLYRKFDECLNLCLSVLVEISNYPECLSAVTLKEGLCVVAIQAYAELNRWQQVLPFVTKLYNGIEDSPHTVVRLCILLHADVKDYPTCSALATIWLRNPCNEPSQGYMDILDVYVTKVLLANNRWDDIHPFLKSCPGLTPQKRDSLLRVVRAFRHQVEQAQIGEIEEIVDEGVPDKSRLDGHGAVSHKGVSLGEETSKSYKEMTNMDTFKQYCHQISKRIWKCLPEVGVYMVRNIGLLAVMLYLLLSRYNIDMLSWKAWHKLWLTVNALWRALFVPFDLVKR